MELSEALHLIAKDPGQHTACHFITFHHLQKLRDCDGDPAVAASPEGLGKVMVPVESPPVIPQTRFRIFQILGMEEELVLGFLNVLLLTLDASHVGKEQHRHKQGIVPQLLIVQRIACHVLETALAGAGESLHDPFRALTAGCKVLFLTQIFSQVGHREKWRHGVDIQGRKPDGKLVVVIACQNVEVFFLFRGSEELPQAENTNALCPFPVLIFADIVTGKIAILHVLQKDLIVLVEDRAECRDQLIKLFVDCRCMCGSFHSTPLTFGLLPIYR